MHINLQNFFKVSREKDRAISQQLRPLTKGFDQGKSPGSFTVFLLISRQIFLFPNNTVHIYYYDE